jgi:hypothetical protein
MKTVLIIHMRSGRDHLISLDEKGSEMDPVAAAEQWHDKFNSEFTMLQVENYVIYCRDIESFEFRRQ